MSAKRKAKFRVGQRVRLRNAATYIIKEKFWDATYGLSGGTWRYRMEGEPKFWVPVQKILRPMTRREKGD